MDVPMYYMTERGPIPWNHRVYCGRAFADTVLRQVNRTLAEGRLAMVHIGVYNPREARRKDGTLIQPVRWSNHAYGEAMDFKGVMVANGAGNFLTVRDMRRQIPDLLDTLVSRCHSAITAQRRKPEIVDEGDWLHVGIWPRARAPAQARVSAALRPRQPQRLAQHLAVADMVGEQEHELGVHQRGLLVVEAALAVDQLHVEAVRIGKVRVADQGHRVHSFASEGRPRQRASAASTLAASKPRQRAATCWSGRIR